MFGRLTINIIVQRTENNEHHPGCVPHIKPFPPPVDIPHTTITPKQLVPQTGLKGASSNPFDSSRLINEAILLLCAVCRSMELTRTPTNLPRRRECSAKRVLKRFTRVTDVRVYLYTWYEMRCSTLHSSYFKIVRRVVRGEFDWVRFLAVYFLSIQIHEKKTFAVGKKMAPTPLLS